VIISKQSGGAIDLEVKVRPPMVYLDNWAICGALAKSGPWRDRFLEIFKLKGTLFFSWTKVYEVSQYGPSRTLLDGIGEHWFPIEWNPYSAIRKERALAHNPGINSPALSESFLRAYYPYIHGGSLALSAVIDLAGKIEMASRRRTIETAVQQFVTDLKKGHSTGPRWLDENFRRCRLTPHNRLHSCFHGC
jgi:hypothetical protein